MAKILQGRSRRVIACLLAYALAAQGFIFALEAGAAIAAPKDQSAAGFILCSHSAGGTTTPDAPLQIPPGTLHCPFCIAGAVYVDCAPPVAPQWNEALFSVTVWPGVAPPPIAFLVNKSAWPRGPPAAA